MIGYKVFDPDWRCRGFQYEVGRTYELEGEIELCQRGFHFCKDLASCFGYYDFNPNNKIAIVEALGKIQESDGDSKCCTSKITIVRELSWSEVLEMVNLGKGNTGMANTGDYNSGNGNSGDHNSGNGNTGDYNSGNVNSGDHNSGHHNSLSRNTGERNSGVGNSGDANSGCFNSGSNNSGDRNSGFWNSGNSNSGRHNSGVWNSSDWNSGRFNSGDHNCGYFNSGDWSCGAFNTGPSKMYLFDEPCDWTLTDFLCSMAYELLVSMPTERHIWVRAYNMADDEKAFHPEYETTGGYLKRVRVSEIERQSWWDHLCVWEKKSVLRLPNFDAEKFYQCTGIRVSEEDLKLAPR